MFKYNHCYKYGKIDINNMEVIVEFSFDNMLNEELFATKTNIMFQDENEDWGHACGVGKTESSALQMLYNELSQYLNCPIKENECVFELNSIPKKITYLDREIPVILFYKIDGQIIKLLTQFGITNIKTENIVNYLFKNKKEYKNLGVTNISQDFMLKNKFNDIFENLTKKYNNTNQKAIQTKSL